MKVSAVPVCLHVALALTKHSSLSQEKHPGSYNIVHVKDKTGAQWATRQVHAASSVCICGSMFHTTVRLCMHFRVEQCEFFFPRIPHFWWNRSKLCISMLSMLCVFSCLGNPLRARERLCLLHSACLVIVVSACSTASRKVHKMWS
jgi:hypothetical protein